MNRFQRIADMIADEVDAEAGPKTGPVQKAVPVAVGLSAKTGVTMNKALVAKELLAIARDLIAIDFPTQDAYDKYMKEHPDADKSNHKVVKEKEEQKQEAPKKHKDMTSIVRDLSKKKNVLEIANEWGYQEHGVNAVRGLHDRLKSDMEKEEDTKDSIMQKYGEPKGSANFKERQEAIGKLNKAIEEGQKGAKKDAAEFNRAGRYSGQLRDAITILKQSFRGL